MASEEVQQLITLLYCYKKTLQKFNKCSMDDDDDDDDDDDEAFKRIISYHK